MIRSRILSAVALALVAAGPAVAAQPKTYQVTGPILEVTNDMIAVQKGKDRWEIGRDASTKTSGGELKPGEKVTVEYRMNATSIEVKSAGGKKKP